MRKSNPISVRLTAEAHALLLSLAAAQGTSSSAQIEQAVRDRARAYSQKAKLQAADAALLHRARENTERVLRQFGHAPTGAPEYRCSACGLNENMALGGRCEARAAGPSQVFKFSDQDISE